MESTRHSCQKQISDGKKRKMASDSSDDRLSALSDCVLTYILSFLSIKLSVSTSILGRRWRCLWSQVPILNFNSSDYSETETAKIINKVMMLHKVTNLDTFRLCLDDCCDFEFEAWIATLSDRNVRNLNIFILYGIKVPLRLFSCKTLVDLTLTGCCVCMDIPSTGPVCLPALKKLHLSGVTYAVESTNKSLPHMLSGCRVLEELFFKVDAPENTMVICHIASPTLSNLVLISEGYAAFEVKLDTPALRYLKLYGSMSDASAGALPSLVEADISFQDCGLFKNNLFSCSVIVFVGKLFNVKCLKLSTGQLKVRSSAFSALTIKFYNLTELELVDDAHFILRFLENADNLQVLTIRKGYGHLSWTDPKQVHACLASHLRTVRIHYVACTEQELSMMRYILRNAKVL